jgi:hypothetical protein
MENYIVSISVKVIQNVIHIAVLFHKGIVDLSEVGKALEGDEGNSDGGDEDTCDEGLREAEAIRHVV